MAPRPLLQREERFPRHTSMTTVVCGKQGPTHVRGYTPDHGPQGRHHQPTNEITTGVSPIQRPVPSRRSNRRGAEPATDPDEHVARERGKAPRGCRIAPPTCVDTATQADGSIGVVPGVDPVDHHGGGTAERQPLGFVPTASESPRVVRAPNSPRPVHTAICSSLHQSGQSACRARTDRGRLTGHVTFPPSPESQDQERNGSRRDRNGSAYGSRGMAGRA